MRLKSSRSNFLMDSLNPTLIANRNRASGRFGSKRIFSMFFPRSSQLTDTKATIESIDSHTYPEEAFQCGITFEAKLVGVLDIPRPQSRMEIVAAMRRVRYDCKLKGLGKRKVDLRISVDGVRVCGRDGGKSRLGIGRVEYDKLDNLISMDVEPVTILNHPIHRIFYVSHDSQDMNVFSYIVRENLSETLRCIVFKARQKTEAMQIVKTIGQAFDVCHVLQQRKDANKPKLTNGSNSVEASPKKLHHHVNNTSITLSPPSVVMPWNDSPEPLHASSHSSVVDELCDRHSATCPNIQRIKKSLSELNPTCRNGLPHTLPGSMTAAHLATGLLPCPSQPFSTSSTSPVPTSLSGINLLAGTRPSNSHSSLPVVTARLELELQKNRAATSQIAFLKSQVASETAERLDAQNRIDELLRQNAMLLDVVESLLAPKDAEDLMHLNSVKDSLDAMKSDRSRRLGGQTTGVHSRGAGSLASDGSSPEGHIGQTSSPDSGVKSAFSYHLNDDEMY